MSAAILSVAVFAAAAPSPAGDTYPYSAAVEVRFGIPKGPESLIEELEHELYLRFDRRGCFERVFAPGSEEAGEADFVVRLILDDFLEETQYEASVAQRALSEDPDVGNRLEAILRVELWIELWARTDDVLVRSDRVRITKSVRPLMPGSGDEWAREEAVRRVIDQAVHDALKKTCKGSAKKLDQQLAKARAEAR